MIQCPDCRQIIPEDSAFCDQCGKELKWCPECKRPKRGTAGTAPEPKSAKPAPPEKK